MEEKENTTTLRASVSIAKNASDIARKNNIPLRVYTDEALKYWNEKYKYSETAVLDLVESKGGSLKLRRDFFERAFKDSKKNIRKHFIDLVSNGSIQNIHELYLEDFKEKEETIIKEKADHFIVILRINPEHKIAGDLAKATSILDKINGNKGDYYESVFDFNLQKEFKFFIMSINDEDKKEIENKEEKNGENEIPE